MSSLGAVSALAFESLLFAQLGTHWLPIRIMASMGLAIPLIVYFALPETSGRSLEEISE